MKQFNDVILFSLDKTDNPASEAQRAAIVALFDAKVVIGMYQGIVETSFLVEYKHFHAVKAISKTFKQDSILVVSDGARLVYMNDNKVEHLGDSKLRQVKDVNGLDAWTMIDGDYYAIS